MTNIRPEADNLPSRTAERQVTAASDSLPYMSAEEAVQLSGTILEQRLKRAPSLIKPYSSYLAASRGKGIRAHSLVLSAMNNEGLIREDAATFAAAIELLHLATLVHDDVMDDADYRRGDETLSKRYGARVAVITGDYLLADVLTMMAEAAEKAQYDELAKPSFLTRYMTRIALGELRQTMFNGNFKIGTSDYLRIIAGKTAALFELSFLTGAIIATKDKRQHDLYRKIGRCVGMVFQITDDCMDYESTLKDAGKNVQNDYEQQVFTLPLIYAMDEDPDLQKDIADGRVDAAHVAARVRDTKSIDRTRRLAKRYQQKALKAIEKLEASEDKRNRLAEIVELSYRIF